MLLNKETKEKSIVKLIIIGQLYLTLISGTITSGQCAPGSNGNEGTVG